MDTKRLTIEIADDGTLVIPVDLVRVLGLSPRQTITVEIRADRLVLIPSQKEQLDRIGRLLRDALKGVEWFEIEAGRQNRCFSA
jgi:bifunctional DNA-binding transcriptional regulator/antitoxin component of YhaV-PrlF toxin-antitoxin module